MADATSLRRTLERRARQATVYAGGDLKTDVRRASPYKTGDTQNSVDSVQFRAGPDGATFTIQATTPQAKWTNDGTRSHIIRPRNKKLLRFVVNGRVVFARQVRHPGNKGTKWFTSTVRDRAPEALRTGWARTR